jgi:hypothetical protein
MIKKIKYELLVYETFFDSFIENVLSDVKHILKNLITCVRKNKLNDLN